uniref:Prominin-1 n=1 Tax=Schistocephalus solidus TaxID=70667 RepID=A0A0X3P063_SCHSO
MVNINYAIFGCLYSILVLSPTVTAEENSSTAVQLRASVAFSHDVANYYLDLIRGNASEEATAEVLTGIRDMARDRPSTQYIIPVFRNFPGYTACVVFGVLFIILVPIIGLFFCCLRCCHRCGGRVKLMDRRKDPCRRVTYTIFLALITTLQLVAIVFAFINYQLHYEAVVSRDVAVGCVPQLNFSAQQFDIAVEQIIVAAKNTSTINLDNQKAKFDAMVDDGLTAFQNDFVRNSSATEVLRLQQEFQSVVFRYAENQLPPTTWRDFIKQLRDLQTELQPHAPSLRASIAEALNTGCEVSKITACRELRTITLEQLEPNFTLEQFQSDDVNKLLNLLASSQTDVHDLDQFNNTIQSMKSDIKRELQPILDGAWRNLSDSPETRQDLVRSMEELAGDVHRSLSAFHSSLVEFTTVRDSPDGIKFREYAYYSGIALICLPVLIIFFYYLGLCFGTCGDRPYEEAGLCNRGVGANLLMAGIVLTFLTAFLMLFCTATFLPGGLVQTELCRYLTNRYPNGPRVIDDTVINIANFVQSSHPNQPRDLRLERFFKMRVAELLLTRCANQTLVDAAGDESIGWMVSNQSINTVLENLLNTFNSIDIISPLRNSAAGMQTTLSKLGSFEGFDFSTAINQLNQPLIRIPDFADYIRNLRSLNIADLKSLVDDLENKHQLLHLQLGLIKEIYLQLNSLGPLYFQLTSALQTFSQDLEQTVPNSIHARINDMRSLFLRELRLAVIASWREIPCTNLHTASVSAVDALCVTYLGPLNGFWASFGTCLLLSIVSLIFAVKLVSLYRKIEKYSPDYEEPDYISYHGFYMRPTNEVDVQRPRKRRGQKGNKNAPQSVSLLKSSE